MNLVRMSLLEAIEIIIQPVIDQCLSQPTLQQLGTQCADLLVLLRQAVEARDALDSNRPVPEALAKCISVNKISKMQLLTCDEMLEAEMLENESLTLKSILIQLGKFQEIENTLNHNYPVDCRLSTIPAGKLCELVAAGNLDAIKNEYISSFRVSQLVSWAVMSGPATYLGKYNALMLAVAHRQVDVVKYLVEMNGVKLDIKGGRDSNLSARDCADKLSILFPEVNPELVAYLDGKLAEKPKMSYRDALSSTFLKPPATKITPDASSLNSFRV